MDSIVDTLMKQITTKDNLSTLTKSVGGNEKGVQSALGMGLPLLLGSMSNSASTSSGSDMLTKMMGQTAAKNPLDNLGGFLNNPQAAIGSNMLSSLLGGQMGGIQKAISQKTGLPDDVVNKVLAIAAPMVIGQVSKSFAGKSVDQNGLTSLLGEQSKLAMQASPDAASLAKQFLTPQESGGIMGFLKKLFGSG
jgi:hypothetical protein